MESKSCAIHFDSGALLIDKIDQIILFYRF